MSKRSREFGDFQTPFVLAHQIVQYSKTLISPKTIVEPTCGQGSFIKEISDSPAQIYGFEIQQQYVDHLQTTTQQQQNIEINHTNYFLVDWKQFYEHVAEPVLVIGNPPWVTNAELTTLNSSNLPHKYNTDNFSGIDAITGKSNFDISEYIIRDQISHISNKNSMIAVICKESVARKIIKHIWDSDTKITLAEIRRISAKKYFNANVAACVLILQFQNTIPTTEISIYDAFLPTKLTNMWILHNRLIANKEMFLLHMHLYNNQKSKHFIWRSGIKHDAARILVLKRTPAGYENKFLEAVNVEEDLIYPYYNGTDVFNSVSDPQKFLIVTQQKIGADTEYIKDNYPKTWNYLIFHETYFGNRKSSVYKNKPKFAIFGVGPYTFLPWKIAVSSFHKHLKFRKISPYQNKTAVFDDTCYFLSFASEADADQILQILNSQEVQEFYHSLIFWDDKRPIKADILNSLNLYKIVKLTGNSK